MRRLYRGKTQEDRFWEKVQKTDACWLWTAGKYADGYGKFRLGGRGSQTIGAHRYVWELVNGEISDGVIIRHTCDNPPCVNPEHLVSGTQQDNVNDRETRNRNYSSNKKFCKRGHPFEGEHLYITKKGTRGCRTCNTLLASKYRAQRRERRT